MSAQQDLVRIPVAILSGEDNLCVPITVKPLLSGHLLNGHPY